MADDSAEHRDPSPGRSVETGREHGRHEASRAADRRRIIIASLLTPPAVMTLGSPSARAGYVNTKDRGDRSSISQSAMRSMDPHNHYEDDRDRHNHYEDDGDRHNHYEDDRDRRNR